MNNVVKKGRAHSQDIFIWRQHGQSCAVCAQSIVNKGGRKPKQQYSHLKNLINIWTKDISRNLIETIPKHHEDAKFKFFRLRH